MSHFSSSGSGSGGSGIITIDGDTGTATGSTVTLTGGSSGAIFTGNDTSTVTMSFNNVVLPASTSTVGQIIQNGETLLQTYSEQSLMPNIFMGIGSGSFTLTGTSNATFGTYNMGNVGTGTASSNTLIGIGCGGQIVNSSRNVAVGNVALNQTDTSNNVAIGYGSLNGGVSGGDGYNIGIGSNAGANYSSSEASNICINNAGTASESNTLHIGAGTGTEAQQLNAAFISGIYGITTGGGSPLAVVIGNNDQLGTISIPGGIGTIDGDSGSVTGSTVTVTGGTSGAVFTGSSSTLTMSFNEINLPTTSSSSVGVINVNGSPFINPFQTSGFNTDFFFGVNAGNFTASSSFGGNTGGGSNAMQALTSGWANSAVGSNGLYELTSGLKNTSLGYDGLRSITSGSRNTNIGWNSGTGSPISGADSDNILINNPGVAGTSNALWIGSGTGTGQQQLNAAYISGIQGITVSGSAVLVSSSDQLGVAVSSARYKDNIADMNDVSTGVLSLRPVTFTYKEDKSNTQQTGLIAEEVDEIMPSLVVYDKEGLPQTVKYHELPVLLLNELQKALKRIDELEKKLL